MAEYIEREKAIQFVLDACNECLDTCAEFDGIVPDCNQCMLDGVHRRLRATPAADVRPVVLCKDCRHRDPEDHKCDSGEMERQGCPFKVADDYFCAYGER